MPTRYEGTECQRAALDLLIKLSRAADSIGARLVPEDLTISQFGVLDALYFVGPMSLGQLAKKHLRSPNNMTSVIDVMERNELVRRKRKDDDRRVIIVELTDKGRELFEKLWPNHLSAVVTTMSVLTIDEQRTLGALLKKLGVGQEPST